MLRQFFGWCQDRNWAKENPASKIDRHTEEKRDIRALSPEEEDQLLRTCLKPPRSGM